MSRSTRRAVSWIGTLALFAAIGVGLAHLPGSGGTAEELRWLLGRDRLPAQHLNRAVGLIVFAEKQHPGARLALYRGLLWAHDPRLVRGAIVLLANELEARRSSDDLAAAFTEWFLTSTPEERLRYQPALLTCCGFSSAFTDPALLPAAVGDYRWLVAGTLWRQHGTRLFVENVLLRESVDRYWLSSRLAILDGDARFPPRQHFAPLASDPLAAALRPRVERLVDMLADKDERVRWGAGRILAAGGDARALPALYDWVKHNPRLMGNADKLMRSLFGANWRILADLIGNTDRLMKAVFGPNWRTIGASSCSARQSSPGDGRR